MAWKRGQWLAVCDVCGWEFLSGQLRKRWDGLMVDDACWETQHPQEFIRPIKESTVPWTRPEPEGIDVSPFDYVEDDYYMIYNSVTGIPGPYTSRTV
jgi:hypothetical protein